LPTATARVVENRQPPRLLPPGGGEGGGGGGSGNGPVPGAPTTSGGPAGGGGPRLTTLDPAPRMAGVAGGLLVANAGPLVEAGAKKLGASDKGAKTAGFFAQVLAGAGYGAVIGGTPSVGVGAIPGAIIGGTIAAVGYGWDAVTAPVGKKIQEFARQHTGR
jgi:hypothetical protein